MSEQVQQSQPATRRHPEAVAPFVQPPRREGGRPRCRWCWIEVPKGRQSWCSDACVREYQLETDWGIIRDFVLKRDKGICALCGHDTVRLTRILEKARSSAKRLHCYSYQDHRAIVLLLGGAPHLYDQWQADHIKARADGGEDHPRNLRTLCISCHKGVTKQQAANRAHARRNAKASLFGGAA